MALTLSTVADGTPMDATTMKTSVASIEMFLNQGIGFAQLQSASSWLRTMHIYRPAYYGGPNTGSTARFEGVSAEVHYFYQDGAEQRRSLHHSTINAGSYVPIFGLGRTFSCAENISAGSAPTKRVHVAACFNVYEFGGDGLPDENTNLAVSLAMRFDGTILSATTRPLYTASTMNTALISSSGAPTGDPGRLCSRKQYAMLYPLECTAGLHAVEICVQTQTMTKGNGYDANNDNWRHVFVANRSMTVEYDYR